MGVLLQIHSLPNMAAKQTEEELLALGFEDLERLDSRSSTEKVESAIRKYSSLLHGFVQILRANNGSLGKTPKVSE